MMGNNVWDWLLPIRGSEGDGIRFPYNQKLVEKLQAKAQRVIRGKYVEEYDAQQRRLATGGIEKEESTLGEPQQSTG